MGLSLNIRRLGNNMDADILQAEIAHWKMCIEEAQMEILKLGDDLEKFEQQLQTAMTRLEKSK